jgi:hypothetical protein
LLFERKIAAFASPAANWQKGVRWHGCEILGLHFQVSHSLDEFRFLLLERRNLGLLPFHDIDRLTQRVSSMVPMTLVSALASCRLNYGVSAKALYQKS